jgi:hypothetical protein
MILTARSFGTLALKAKIECVVMTSRWPLFIYMTGHYVNIQGYGMLTTYKIETKAFNTKVWCLGLCLDDPL